MAGGDKMRVVADLLIKLQRQGIVLELRTAHIAARAIFVTPAKRGGLVARA